MTHPPTPVAVRRYAKIVAAATLFLIYAGAMVTSTGSGLAVPDWPLSYGMLFPPMVGGIFYEHGHRMVAAAVGFLTLIQAFVLQKKEPKPFVRKLGWIALGAVIIQGILGGLTVRYFLPTPISVSHASLAEIFLCLNVAIAFFTSAFYTSAIERPTTVDRRPPATLLCLFVFAQIVVGAFMRHMEAGLAIPDFPLSFGQVIPRITTLEIGVNFAHRAWGITLTTIVLFLSPLFLRIAGPVRRFYSFLLMLFGLQVMLGALTVLSKKQPVITSIHVVTGATIMATTFLLALIVRTLEQASAPVTSSDAVEVPA